MGCFFKLWDWITTTNLQELLLVQVTCLSLLKGLFRLAANLLQPATGAVHCSKNRKFPTPCSNIFNCNSRCCNLWTRLKATKGQSAIARCKSKYSYKRTRYNKKLTGNEQTAISSFVTFYFIHRLATPGPAPVYKKQVFRQFIKGGKNIFLRKSRDLIWVLLKWPW